jgi:hypothetical protein
VLPTTGERERERKEKASRALFFAWWFRAAPPRPASQPARTHDQQHDLDGAGEGSIASLSIVACLTHTYPGG